MSFGIFLNKRLLPDKKTSNFIHFGQKSANRTPVVFCCLLALSRGKQAKFDFLGGVAVRLKTEGLNQSQILMPLDLSGFNIITFLACPFRTKIEAKST